MIILVDNFLSSCVITKVIKRKCFISCDYKNNHTIFQEISKYCVIIFIITQNLFIPCDYKNNHTIFRYFCHFWTALNPCPGGLDPSSIYHWKAHKLLYIHHISDLPDAQLTCLRSVTYATITTFIIEVEFKISPGRSVKAMTHSMLNLKFLLESNEQKPTRNKEKTLPFERNFTFNSC